MIKRHRRLNPGWDERPYFEHYIRTLKRQGYFPRDIAVSRRALMDYHHAWRRKRGADLEWLKVAWKLLMFMPSTLVRYAAIDDESKEMFTHMFLGSLPVAEIKNRIFYLIARDFLE